MDYPIMMESASGSFYFRIFYLLAFLVAYVILLYEGYRRKFPILKWILIIACIRLFLVSGTKLFAYSREEWQFIFENHMFILGAKKTLFGGLLLGSVGYLIGRQWFSFRNNALDAVAVAMPLSVSIQKIGCFFAGCCFGNPSRLPWAVQYPVLTLPHYHQYQSGLITSHDMYSLPVHPAQLYFVLGGFLVVFLVIRTRKYWKAAGSSLLSSLIFYAFIRFILEFFRDPLSNKGGGDMLWILKMIQWQLLIFAIVMTLVLIYRERKVKPSFVEISNATPALNSSISFVFFLVLIFWLLRNCFTSAEVIAMNIALLPAIILVVFNIFSAITVRQYKWLYAGVLIFPVFLMGQTIAQSKIDTTLKKSYNTYKTISAGYANGEYVNSHTIGEGEGCDRVSNTNYFSHHYKVLGGGFSIFQENQNKVEIIEYGINTYFGHYRQTRLSDNHSNWENIFGLNPYVNYDLKWFGIGGGLHIGNLIFIKENRDVNGLDLPESGNLNTFIYPQLYLRFGVKKYFYGDFHMADQFPSSTPGLRYQFGVGTGFGLKNGLTLRFGTTMLKSSSTYSGSNPFKHLQSEYISARIPIHDRIIIEPLYFWGQKPSGFYGLYPSSPQFQFSLGLHYSFGQKELIK